MPIAQEKRQLEDVVNGLIKSALARLHTIAVVKVTSIALDKKTIGCRIVWNLVYPDGSDEPFCEFVQVPLINLSGGSSYLAFPVSEGDYGLLFITERCFDRWYMGRDFEKPARPRMHDYSDGFCLVGLQPFLGAIAIPDETTLTGPMRLGSPDPTDAVALASKVLAELARISVDLATLKAASSASFALCTPLTPGDPTKDPKLVYSTATALVPSTPAPVASLLVKAD